MTLPFKTTFALALVLIGIAVGALLHRLACAPQTPITPPQDSADVARLFSTGLNLPTSEQDQAEFLTQLSLRHQETLPSLVPTLWLRYQDYLEKQGLSPEDYLLRLEVFLESVDKAALMCDTETAFKSVWRVRKQILEQRRSKATALVSALGHEIDALLGDIQKANKEGTFQEAIKPLAERGEGLLATIRAVKTSWIADQQAASGLEGKMEAVVADVLKLVSTQLTELRKERDIESGKDTAGNGPEYGNGDALDEKGKYESLARRAAQLRASLDAADLPTWLGLISEGKNTVSDKGVKTKRSQEIGGTETALADAQTQIEQLLSEVSRLQGLRYNLWALRTIYRAQQSTSWDGLLGKIDVGLLQPTVSALYSSTYDSLIREKTDPRTRIVAVQNILNGKKAALSSF